MLTRLIHRYRVFGFTATCSLAAWLGVASGLSYAGPVTFVDVSAARGIGPHVSEEGHGTGVFDRIKCRLADREMREALRCWASHFDASSIGPNLCVGGKQLCGVLQGRR